MLELKYSQFIKNNDFDVESLGVDCMLHSGEIKIDGREYHNLKELKIVSANKLSMDNIKVNSTLEKLEIGCDEFTCDNLPSINTISIKTVLLNLGKNLEISKDTKFAKVTFHVGNGDILEEKGFIKINSKCYVIGYDKHELSPKIGKGYDKHELSSEIGEGYVLTDMPSVIYGPRPN